MQQLSFENDHGSEGNLSKLLLPPQNIEAEESILGGIMLDPEAIGRVRDRLIPEAFYVSAHKDIYQAELCLEQSGKPTDLLSVVSWLTDHDLLVRIGGRNKLATLVDRTVSAVNIDGLAELVMDKYLRRQLIKAGNEVVRLGYQFKTELPTILDQAEQKVFGVTQERRQSALVHIAETLINNFQDIEDRSQGVASPGIRCGFYDLDALTCGFSRSDLIILAARPSVGKTAFSLNLAYNIAANSLPVAIFSLEMSRDQLTQRLLASEAQIESNYLRTGRINERQWEPLSRAIAVLSELPIYIDDTSNITVNLIRSESRRLQAELGTELGLILVDYLQLMEGGTDNRVQELSKITRQLKSLARELNVPIIALSQLSRGVESRNNKRPLLSDLRESGCLAGDSLVNLVSHGEIPIKELVGKCNFKVLSLNRWTMKLESATVSNVFCTGKKQLFRLSTRNGASIRATGNHKFLGTRDWVELDNLKVGDYIRMPVSIGNELLTATTLIEIVSIEPDGEEEVFDLTVPGLENFVANGIIVHNSIEQDADLVIMLYRDEYYNPETPDRGIAELIVSKHRNGATGTVKLLFNPQFGKFQNLRI